MRMGAYLRRVEKRVVRRKEVMGVALVGQRIAARLERARAMQATSAA